VDISQWRFFKEKENSNIMPFWRAFFGLLFLAELFKKILALAKERGYQRSYPPWLLWTIIFSLLFVSIMYLPAPYRSLLSALTALGYIPALLAVNHYWNYSDTQLIDRPFKWWHAVLLLLGALMWILVLIPESMFQN
jgi:hypothetical protein